MTDPQNPVTSGLGERRRRREAERARLAEAERPLSRRERRALEEAIERGAVTVGPEGVMPTSEFQRIEAEALVEGSSSSASAASAATGETAGSAASPEWPPSSSDEAQAGEASQQTPIRTRRSHRRVVEQEAAPAPWSDPLVEATGETAPTAEQASEPQHPATDPTPAVTRRSLRSKARLADDGSQPSLSSDSEINTTGTRPVVRPPSSVRARRGVSETGELTGIQLAIRDANTAADQLPVVADSDQDDDSPTSWGSAVGFPAVTGTIPAQDPASGDDHDDDGDGNEQGEPGTQDEAGVATPESAPPGLNTETPVYPGDLDALREKAAVSPGSAASPASPEEEAGEDHGKSRSADSPSDGEGEGAQPAAGDQPGAGDRATDKTEDPYFASGGRDDGVDELHDDADFDLTPNWQSLGITNNTAPEGSEAEPDSESDSESGARKTPGWLVALQVLALLVAVAVLGLLVYLLATGELLGDDGAAVSTASQWSARTQL